MARGRNSISDEQRDTCIRVHGVVLNHELVCLANDSACADWIPNVYSMQFFEPDHTPSTGKLADGLVWS